MSLWRKLRPQHGGLFFLFFFCFFLEMRMWMRWGRRGLVEARRTASASLFCSAPAPCESSLPIGTFAAYFWRFVTDSVLKGREGGREGGELAEFGELCLTSPFRHRLSHVRNSCPSLCRLCRSRACVVVASIIYVDTCAVVANLIYVDTA